MFWDIFIVALSNLFLYGNYIQNKVNNNNILSNIFREISIKFQYN